MYQIKSYIAGEWLFAGSKSAALQSALDGSSVGEVSTQAPAVDEALIWARNHSKPLRQLTFHDRARTLKALALYLMERKESYYQLSYSSGATKIDSWIDIEGGIGTLFAFSSKGRRELPNQAFMTEGSYEALSKGETFGAVHLLTPKPGVACHINAFNFPIWGMLEKFACNFLAGMPAIIKPASQTCYLTELMVKDMIASNLLPKGSLQLICGPVGNLLDLLTEQDVVTFTGSAITANKLRSHPNLISRSIPFNAEADSLNFCMLGPDVQESDEEFSLFIKEVLREVTVKSGQKCTAIRRVLVPEQKVEAVARALKDKLVATTIGDPRLEGVRMGALASLSQRQDVISNIELLQKSCTTLLSFKEGKEFKGQNTDKGAFLAPTLLLCESPLKNLAPHEVEAFGPVTTLIPYKNLDEASELIKLGRGSLVGSLVSTDHKVMRTVVMEVAAFHGRLLILNRTSAKESTGHGSPLPQLVHGGPGRAGGGEEMGGVRGVKHYLQRTALQGNPTDLTAVTQTYCSKADQVETAIHPFKKYFDELVIGETLVTHKRTVTETDIVSFACLTGDHFYAHMDETSLEGSLFEKRVAHGYFLMAAAAGLFVDPKRGPVLANYGVDEFRFIKPVYVGATIGVRLTVKEKIAQDKRPDDLIEKGIVKWQVDIYDQTGETVALGTILTLVQRATL